MFFGVDTLRFLVAGRCPRARSSHSRGQLLQVWAGLYQLKFRGTQPKVKLGCRIWWREDHRLLLHFAPALVSFCIQTLMHSLERCHRIRL